MVGGIHRVVLGNRQFGQVIGTRHEHGDVARQPRANVHTFKRRDVRERPIAQAGQRIGHDDLLDGRAQRERLVVDGLQTVQIGAQINAAQLRAAVKRAAAHGDGSANVYAGNPQVHERGVPNRFHAVGQYHASSKLAFAEAVFAHGFQRAGERDLGCRALVERVCGNVGNALGHRIRTGNAQRIHHKLAAVFVEQHVVAHSVELAVVRHDNLAQRRVTHEALHQRIVGDIRRQVDLRQRAHAGEHAPLHVVHAFGNGKLCDTRSAQEARTQVLHSLRQLDAGEPGQRERLAADAGYTCRQHHVAADGRAAKCPGPDGFQRGRQAVRSRALSTFVNIGQLELAQALARGERTVADFRNLVGHGDVVYLRTAHKRAIGDDRRAAKINHVHR